MHIVHLALGGCLKAPPVHFGITADTGGHIAYVVEAALAQARHPDVRQVTLVTRRFDDDRLGREYAQLYEKIAANAAIVRIATPNPSYLEKEALAAELPAFIESFCAYIADLELRPDVIHAHFADAAAVAAIVERRFGIPFVYTPHALGLDKQRQGFECPSLFARIESERAAIRHASAIIVSTKEEASRQLGAYGVALGTRARIIPPGAPAKRLTGEPTIVDALGNWLSNPDKPIILAIARPVAKKNLAALIRAYASDSVLIENANLVILAGQHDHASDEEAAIVAGLRKVAGSPELRGRIALPPRHSAADVAALYDRASKGGLFVNPALHEPFGLTLLEAAAAGVPVVSTKRGGAAEIVNNLGHGLLIDPTDEPAIAAAMREILGDPVRRRRFAAAAKRGAKAYDWSRYAAASISAYADLAEPGLLACDIDNTLTGNRRAAASFAAWRSASAMPFVVATGRSLRMAQAILAEWGLPVPDAFIVDVGTRLMLPDGQGDWRECPDFAAALDREWDRKAVEAALGDLELDLQPPQTAGPHKLSYFGDEAEAMRIRSALASAGVTAQVIFSHGRLIDVIAPAGGKANAIASYAARLGLSLAECIAAGDSGNDADMLAACGNAIIVGNASEELADLPERAGLYRAAALNADGVIEGLARLGLAVLPTAKVA